MRLEKSLTPPMPSNRLSVIRKATVQRKLFPHDEAAMKVIYLAIEQTAKKWSMPLRDWKPAINQFMIMFPDRMPHLF
jgi:transposase-like protein